MKKGLYLFLYIAIIISLFTACDESLTHDIAEKKFFREQFPAKIEYFSVISQGAEYACHIKGNQIFGVIPYGHDRSILTTNFLLFEYADSWYGGQHQVPFETVVDFTEQVSYFVTGRASVNKAWYFINITNAENDEAKLYSIKATINNEIYEGVIHDDKTVEFTIPYSTEIQNVKLDYMISPEATASMYEMAVPHNDDLQFVDIHDKIFTVNSQSGLGEGNYVFKIKRLPNNAAIMKNFSINNGIMYTCSISGNEIITYMSYNTRRDNAIALFETSDNARVYVGAEEQTSGTSVQNFHNDVTYRVVSEDGQVETTYTVKVIELANSGAELKTFTLLVGDNKYQGVFLGTHIEVNVPFGTDITNAKAEFTLSDNAVITVNDIEQYNTETPNNFTSPVPFTVTSQDGEKTSLYTVKVNVLQNTRAEIQSYQITDSAGLSFPTIINDKEITVNVPTYFDLENVKSHFSLSKNALLLIDSVNQTSGATVNDMTLRDVNLTVLSEDGSLMNTYTLKIGFDYSSDAVLKQFSVMFGDTNYNGMFTEKNITISVPFGTDITSGLFQFTASYNTTIKVLTPLALL